MSTSPSKTEARVVTLEVPADQRNPEPLLDEIRHLEGSESCRVILLRLPEGITLDPVSAERVSDLLRFGPRVVIAVLDGDYDASAITLSAGADLAVASARTRFLLDYQSVGFHESWFTNLGLRDLKWLTFCAGPLSVDALKQCGFLNFVFPSSDLDTRASELAENIARIPSDLLTVKKRAHETRHRIVGSSGR